MTRALPYKFYGQRAARRVRVPRVILVLVRRMLFHQSHSAVVSNAIWWGRSDSELNCALLLTAGWPTPQSGLQRGGPRPLAGGVSIAEAGKKVRPSSPRTERMADIQAERKKSCKKEKRKAGVESMVHVEECMRLKKMSCAVLCAEMV